MREFQDAVEQLRTELGVSRVFLRLVTPGAALPPVVASRLGLDDGPAWIRVDELNRFAWPGFDLRPIPGRAGAFAYGFLPRPLFEQVRALILDGRRKARTIPRD